MNAQPKQPHRPHFSGSFDSRLKQALNKAKIPYVEKVKLFQAIVDVCKEHVEDCCDSLTAALYLVLHDDHGFGQQRINRLKDRTQDTIDSYVDKYDIGTICALYRDLKERRIIIIPRQMEESL
jgi:hypothetical protein